MTQTVQHPIDEGSSWTIAGVLGGTISWHLYLALAGLGFLGMLGLWWLLATHGWVDPLFLPHPQAVARRAWQWLFQDDLLDDLSVSLYRVGAGFGLSVLMALPLAVLTGRYQVVRALLEPLMEFARYLPAVALVPLFLLWFGLGEASKIAIIWVGTFFQMVLLMSDSIRAVPRAQIEAAQTMGAAEWEVIAHVIVPAALPALVDNLRVTLGWAWTYLVVAELVAANTGLGYAILRAQRFLQTDTIFVGVLLIGLLGLVSDQLFRLLHRMAFPYLRCT